jgi:murein DD-endopeptidase MepM/ murein hydrolase activator NlpD
MKRAGVFVILFLPLWLLAQVPKAFSSQALVFEQESRAVSKMAAHAYFRPQKEALEAYLSEIEEAFAVGYRLDDAIAKRDPEAAKLRKKYLRKLREVQKTQKAIEKLYDDALCDAMDTDETELFSLLVENPMEPLQRRSLRKRLLSYYKKKRHSMKIAAAEAMLEDAVLEEASSAYVEQEAQAFEENLQVMAEAEAKRLRRKGSAGRRYKVIVSTKQTGDGYDFYAENLNPYNVTVKLDFTSIENFALSRSMPMYFELLSKEHRKILHLQHLDRSRKASFRSSFGWATGLSSAKHDGSVLYRIPFAQGSRAVVSQGYNGASTHKGASRYAVDFVCPIGTPVHAARGGKVVATEESNDKGGFSKAYGKYANYVIVEHDDGTHGNYYHLKKKGAAVKVGDRVRAGDLLGYSGSTGYSSGPHLHFSVTRVEKGSWKQMSLPFRFRTQKRIVSLPKRGDVYSVGGM